jgi:hypothetical protein
LIRTFFQHIRTLGGVPQPDDPFGALSIDVSRNEDDSNGDDDQDEQGEEVDRRPAFLRALQAKDDPIVDARAQMVESDKTIDELLSLSMHRGVDCEQELKDVPPQTIDPSKWPKGIRPISIGETGGLGIDRDGRLYWNGKPVEIIGRRLDLTKPQFALAVIAAIATSIRAIATCVQAGTAYHEWACKVHWSAWVACPEPPALTKSPDPGLSAG